MKLSFPVVPPLDFCKADNSNTAQFDYTYNNRDVRTSVEKTIGASTQTINYTYDNIDQLTKELSTETTPALNKEYSYDAMGNRVTSSVAGTSTSYTSNNLNQVTQTTVGGNNTAIAYDANGNMVTEGSKTFGYNDADQLTSVVVPGEKKSEFVYDSSGLKRIAKEYTWDAAANGGAGGWTQSDETRFVYDGMDLIQERAADGTVKASYVRDGNIGGVLSMTNADGTFYYHYDGSGNVTSMTDANQNVVAQYSYDAFGNLLSSSGSEADKNPFRFSSKYYDDDTGLYDYGYRSYDASLGRWINRDPMGEDGGLNLYGMVGNDPINATDTIGLMPIIQLSGLNVYGGDQNPDVSGYGWTYGYSKTPHASEELTKPSKKDFMTAMLSAKSFYFWGHGLVPNPGHIEINDHENLTLSDIKWLAKTRKAWGVPKMDFVT